MQQSKTRARFLAWLTMIGLISLLTLFTGCHSNPSTGHGSDIATTYNGIGTVVAMNPQRPSIEINHQEIKGYMPAMQMEFPVKDRSLLDSINTGDKVDFTLEVNQGIERIIVIHKR
jgi:Cu/Ag efflux protein CusF